RLDVARDLFRTSQAGFFFFQAEDGIRDFHVTGVQTCALPICLYDCGIAAAAKRCGLTQALGGTLTRTATHEPRTANTIASWLLRSEERRVGKERRYRWWAEHRRKNERTAESGCRQVAGA